LHKKIRGAVKTALFINQGHRCAVYIYAYELVLLVYFWSFCFCRPSPLHLWLKKTWEGLHGLFFTLLLLRFCDFCHCNCSDTIDSSILFNHIVLPLLYLGSEKWTNILVSSGHFLAFLLTALDRIWMFFQQI